MPHCTWNWDKVDPTGFEVRDGLVCAGRQCLDEGFYDRESLRMCGFSREQADEIFWVKSARPRRKHPRLVALQQVVAEKAGARRQAVDAAITDMDACIRAVEEVGLLTNEQAKKAFMHCSHAFEAGEAGMLRDEDAVTLTQAHTTLKARIAATGGN